MNRKFLLKQSFHAGSAIALWPLMVMITLVYAFDIHSIQENNVMVLGHQIVLVNLVFNNAKVCPVTFDQLGASDLSKKYFWWTDGNKYSV